MSKPARLTLLDPDLIGVRGQQEINAEPHVRWYVGYAPEPEPGLPARVVFATLHAAGSQGVAEVTVACLMGFSKRAKLDDAAFKAALVGSDALEALYDAARVHFRTVVAMVGADIEVPSKAPEPALSTLQPRDDSASEAKSLTGGDSLAIAD